MPSAKGLRAGGFSAFERLQRPGGEASTGNISTASRRVARPPPPVREVSLEEVRTLLEDLRTTVVALSFQKALEHVRSRDWGALKKRAGVAKLLGIAWKAPLKASGFAIDGFSFPRVLTAVRSHSGQSGIRLLSEEVEKLLKFFPGALFGSQAGAMKGIPPSPSRSGRGGAFSKLAPGRQDSGPAPAPAPARPGTLRGRPMGLGEAKDILRRLKDDCSTKEFQQELLDIGRSGHPNREKAVAAFVCRAWSSAMSAFDFPVAPSGFREMADGILRCAYNRHVEMLAHEVEALLHVPTGSLFGVAPEEAAGEEEESEVAAHREARPGDIDVLLTHNAERTELWVSVHNDATFGDLKEAAARKLGRNTILTMGRLVRKSGAGTFVSYKDTDSINHVREVLVLGADLKMDDGQPQLPIHQGTLRLSFDDMTLVTQQAKEPQGRGVPVLNTSTAQKLLAELHAGYAERDFQRRLQQFYSTLGATTQFGRERQRLALEVQTVVLPKYGFRGNMDGVVDMQRALAEFVTSNDEMRRIAEDCDNLLLAKVTAKKKIKTETIETPVYNVNKEKVQPEPEEPPVVPAADPEPEPPSRQEPRVEVKPPLKPVAPAKEVYFVVRHATNEKDEEVWMKMMSNATFAEVKSRLANKLGREEVQRRGRLVFRAESGAGVWTDFLDEEELGRDRRVLHLMGVALPPKEIKLLIRHAIKEDGREVSLGVWTNWKFRDVKQALADKLGRKEVSKQAKFVFRPNGLNAQGAWAAFKDEEQVGERSELNVLGVDDLAPTPQAQQAIEEAERQAKVKAEEAKLKEEAEQRTKEERKAKEDVERRASMVADAERRVREAAVRRAKAEAEESTRRAREEAEQKEKEEAARKAKEKKAERKAKKEALLSIQGESERRPTVEAERRVQESGQEATEVKRAGEEAESRTGEEAERRAKVERRETEEFERRAREAAERRHGEELERREREEAEQRHREQSARREREQVERKEREEADRREREEAERRQREEVERRRREECERREREEAERRQREERERKEREEAERRRREECEQRQREEAERRRREECERKEREEAERRQREEAERRRRKDCEREREEAERRQREQSERRERDKEESERGEREEAERVRREKLERKEREELERKEREEAEQRARRKAREEEERKAREEAERKEAEEATQRTREAEQRAREEAEQEAREEAQRRAAEEAHRKAKEESEKKAKEEAEQAAREEAQRRAAEEAKRKAKEESEKKATEEAAQEARQETDRKAKQEAERVRRLKEAMEPKLKGMKQAAATPVAPPRLSHKELVASIEPAVVDQEPGEGRLWIVVGGEDKGGILVRKGEPLDSKPYAYRLVTGTRVEELEVVGNRFHYKRIRGDGPDFGWVNIKLNEKVLLEPEELG